MSGPMARGSFGEWSGQAARCASRDGCNGLAAFLADLRSAPPVGGSQLSPRCHAGWYRSSTAAVQAWMSAAMEDS